MNPQVVSHRWAQQGEPLAGGLSGALLEMRADLLEFVGACGFKTWANNSSPCFCCDCSKDDLFKFPANIATSTWVPRDAAMYNRMVQNSLKTRIVGERQFRDLRGELSFDGRHGGIHS
jgi:hypothetical protein